jgi:flagellar biosynthetic protein FliQ
MTPEFAVRMVRDCLMAAFWLAAPLLLAGFVIAIVINIIQIATSLQDQAFSMIPKLAAALFGFLLLMPWMLHKLSDYAISILGNLGRYAS